MLCPRPGQCPVSSPRCGASIRGNMPISAPPSFQPHITRIDTLATPENGQNNVRFLMLSAPNCHSLDCFLALEEKRIFINFSVQNLFSAIICAWQHHNLTELLSSWTLHFGFGFEGKNIDSRSSFRDHYDIVRHWNGIEMRQMYLCRSADK